MVFAAVCGFQESFERSVDEPECSWPPKPVSNNILQPLVEHFDSDVLSPLSVRGGVDGEGIYDEIDFSERRVQVATQSVPASVPRLSLNNFGNLSKLPEVRSKDDDGDGSDGLNSRDDSVTECDSRPITARSRCSSRGDGTVSREGSRDSRRTHPEDGQSDGQPLSARSLELRERQTLSARGQGGGGGSSDAGGSDISEGAPLSARTSSGDVRGLPPFSPRFLSPRVGPPGGIVGGGGGLGTARPSPRLHSVTSAGPRSILSPRWTLPGTILAHAPSHGDVVQAAGPWGIVGDSPRRQVTIRINCSY